MTDAQLDRLAAMIADGLRGMTSNPTIFEHAIAGSADYDEALAEAGASGMTDREVYEALAIQDVQEAADVFRSVYDETHGEDGFVSIEVSPELARDTAERRRPASVHAEDRDEARHGT